MTIASKYYDRIAELAKDLPHILSVNGYQQTVLLEKYDAADELALKEFRSELEASVTSALSDTAREAIWKKAYRDGVAAAGTKHAFYAVEKEYIALTEFFKEATS